MGDVIFENTGFNVKYWAPYSLNDFIGECTRDRILKQYSGEIRIEVLTLVKQLINDAARNG